MCSQFVLHSSTSSDSTYVYISSNKYSLLGAMRNVAAIVSYEMPLVLAIVGVVLIAGSLSLNRIVIAQDIPFILLQPLGFFLFFAAGCAEINRSPFDLMEADSEIVAGFHTEYSGMKFAMFYLVEYAEAIAIAAIITISCCTTRWALSSRTSRTSWRASTTCTTTT